MFSILQNQEQNLPKDKSYVDVDINSNLSTGQIPKPEFQDWLDTFQFGLFHTIEPTPSSPMKDDDMKQRIREIDHKINRHFIGNEFSRFRNEMDRFWLVGFFENGHPERSGERSRLFRHSHILHYIPYHQMNVKGSKIFQRNLVKDQFQFLWDGNETTNTEYLLSSKKTKHWFEVQQSTNRPIPPVWIETISTRKDSVSVSRYSSKKIHLKEHWDDIFWSK
jgi:hypothetical protein